MQSLLAISAVLAALVALAAGDAVPVFDRNIYTPTLSEDVAVSTSVITVLATDADGAGTPAGQITYSLSAVDKLNVDPSTGVVTVASTLDYESTAKITLTLTATDGDGNEANSLLILSLTDINDNNPVFLQVYSETIEAVNGIISTMTPYAISALDVDSGVNSQLTYSIVSGNVNNVFAIDASSGELTVAQSFDSAADSFSAISLTVQASDNGVPSRSATTVVTLTPQNTVVGVTYTCDTEWMVNRGDGKCYKLVKGEKSWQSAQNYCRWLGVRSGLTPGNLVTIGDSDTQDWLVNSLMNKRRSFWTGLNDQDVEGSMTWVDGSSFTSGTDYSNWAILNSVQQPAGGSTKNCMAVEGTIRSLGTFLGKWNDFKCAMKTWSICEFPAKVVA